MKRVKVHRLVWETLMGPIPDGMLVCHSCDNPSCMRPDHLFVGTHADNQHDKWAKGRGVTNPHRKFSNAQIIEIRARYATGTIRQRQLAAEFGVTQSVISRIVIHKSYK